MSKYIKERTVVQTPYGMGRIASFPFNDGKYPIQLIETREIVYCYPSEIEVKEENWKKS